MYLRSKIEVSYSKYEQRTSYWKKVGRSNIAEKRKDELVINKPGQSEKQRKVNIETNLGGAILGKVLSQGGQKSGKNLTKGLVNPKVEENEFQSMGAEHVTLTITTSQMERINGEVTLKVGKDKHIPAAGLKFATPSASSSGSSSVRVERPACSGFGIGNTINMIFNDGSCSEGGVNSRVAERLKESGLETDKVHEVSDCEFGLAPAVQNWADSIDELNNNNHSLWDRAEYYQESSDVEVAYNKDNGILEEHHRVVSGKSKRKKKYGSLYSLQDRVLSEADRRKRDRALRKLKKQNCEDELSADIDEDSLTSSDLRGRWKLLTRNATELLEFGSRVGFQVEGDMNMTVSELARAMDRDE
ncbi:hypothetical protein GQ457_16G027450 [Hibiscus cannabinus]